MGVSNYRADLDAFLGNPTQAERAAAAHAARQGTVHDVINVGRTTRNVLRQFGRQLTFEEAVSEGQPPFPHQTCAFLTVITGGLFGPVYWLLWMVSARRRYQRRRRAALRTAGYDIWSQR